MVDLLRIRVLPSLGVQSRIRDRIDRSTRQPVDSPLKIASKKALVPFECNLRGYQWAAQRRTIPSLREGLFVTLLAERQREQSQNSLLQTCQATKSWLLTLLSTP